MELITRSLEDLGPRSSGGPFIPRLPFSRQEAETILKLIPAGKGMKALDFDANWATVTSPLLAQYQIVHIATHALANSTHPQLSGLVFSLVNKQGKSQEGFLGLQDIYNLNLPVELVVLSACETGLGKEIRNEGLVGMTRAFMYAGATRVVASLWKVDDAATADLMDRFYRAMLQEGLSPAAALRKAQIETAKDWDDPYFWAGFVLQGEWKAPGTPIQAMPAFAGAWR
jgi:CHAT domain-containing protein